MKPPTATAPVVPHKRQDPSKAKARRERAISQMQDTDPHTAKPQTNAQWSENKPEYKERQPQWTAVRHHGKKPSTDYNEDGAIQVNSTRVDGRPARNETGHGGGSPCPWARHQLAARTRRD